jgi:hypothetical protein
MTKLSKTKYILALFAFVVTGLLVMGLSEGSGNSTENNNLGLGVNFRLHPSPSNALVAQTETFITRHPTNPNILFASANAYSFSGGLFISEGVYVSTDAGASWYGSDTCKGNPINFHGGDPGIAISGNGNFIITRLGRQPFDGLYSHYSTDNGVTWSNQITISTDLLERATTQSDHDQSSPYYGRTYAAWVKFTPPYPISLSYTSNNGISWTPQLQINNPPQRSYGGDLVVGLGGKVNVTWSGVQNTSPFTEVYAGYAYSTNGGQSFNVTENAFNMNGIQGFLPEKNGIRVNGLPRIAVDNTSGPRSGWLYIVTTQKNLAPAGTDPDIILNRSTDGGQTWQPGIRVNQDPLNDGKIQYFPAVHVDDGGGLNIIYYDDRTTTSDSSSVFLSRSTDGGNTFHDFKISDHNFEPRPVSGGGQGYQGDNISLTSLGDILWATWMDNSVDNNYQMWAAPIDLNSISINNTGSEIPGVFALKQNYPNPFNPGTKIGYAIKRSGIVIMKVYDINGREVTELVNKLHQPGYYEVDFNIASISGLASGVYFYSLQIDNSKLTKSMVLLK